MKKILICLSMLMSIPCFAITEEDEISKPMHYALEPMVGYHAGYSQLSGSNSISSGFSGGLGFRFSREGYFFTPDVKLTALVGLDKSPLTMWSFGFLVGGRFPKTNLDLFLGLDDASMIAYKVNSAAIVKVGLDLDLGLSDFQIYLDGFYGAFTEVTQVTATTQLNQNFPYAGIEVGIQIPIDL